MESTAHDHCEGTPPRRVRTDATSLPSRSQQVCMEIGAKRLDMTPASPPMRSREGFGICRSTPGKRAPSASPLIATPLRAQRRRLAAASMLRAVKPCALEMALTSSSCDGPVVCWFTAEGELKDFAVQEPQEPQQLSPSEDLAAALEGAEPVLEISVSGSSAGCEGVTDPRKQSSAGISR